MRDLLERKMEEAQKRKGGKYWEIAQMTDDNNHTGAYLEGAKLLGYKKLVKLFGLIRGIQDIEGHLPGDVDKYRYDLYKMMIKQAKKDLSKEDYEAFYGAF